MSSSTGRTSTWILHTVPGLGEAAGWAGLASAPRGPLCPAVLCALTCEVAFDYFIAWFRAASGAVLSNVSFGRVSLCFD